MGAELRHEWARFADAERAVWHRLIGDDLTAGFYQSLRGDVAELGVYPQRSDSLRTVLRLAERHQVDSAAWTDNDSTPESNVNHGLEGDWMTLLNADLPAMEDSVKAATVSEELSALQTATDVDAQLAGKDELLRTAVEDLVGNFAALATECQREDDDELIRYVYSSHCV